MTPLAITVCATRSYAYAMEAQARRVVANVLAAKLREPGHVVLVSDGSDAMRNVRKCYETVLPEGWHVTLIENKQWAEVTDGTNYKERAQLLIAGMREAAFTMCRKLGARRTWSLDSDVLPPANALRCMLTMLEFDAGYYSVSTCPYPNTAYLGGRGTPSNPIAEDYLPHERVLTDEAKAALAAMEEEQRQLAAAKQRPTNEQRERWEEARKKVKACPPAGNVFRVNAEHGWRRRGWLEHAYPAIGRGAVVPSDWCGFGCTLLNEEALTLASFEGYEGKGTEDLYVCWHRWYPAGLRLNVITHCPCDHVIWERKKGGDAAGYTHYVAYHETEGECVGHLRVRPQPWIRL